MTEDNPAAALRGRTVGDIAASLPGATAVFRRFRIDFCCNGSRTLEESGALSGNDVQSILKRLIEYVSPVAGGVDESAGSRMAPDRRFRAGVGEPAGNAPGR